MVVYPSKKRYDKKNVVRVSVAFNRSTEPELVDYIESIDNKSGHIKDLLKAEMKKREDK